MGHTQRGDSDQDRGGLLASGVQRLAACLALWIGVTDPLWEQVWRQVCLTSPCDLQASLSPNNLWGTRVVGP